MYFVRAAFDEDDEFGVQCALASHDPHGIDEGNLADGRREYLIYFATAAEAAACAAALAPPVQTAVEHQPDQNWNATWQAGWQPCAVGQRFFLTPRDFKGTPPPGRLALPYHPGTAFGNGDHPTTQLCLEWLEELVRPGDTVIDAGCGSGLLCQAAAALGARAVGFDLDEMAVHQAHAYGVAAFVGSADAVAAADVVVANIQLGVLEHLLPELRRIARRELILSGLLDEQAVHFPGLRKSRLGWTAIRT